jgi:hypothetical protein
MAKRMTFSLVEFGTVYEQIRAKNSDILYGENLFRNFQISDELVRITAVH